MKKFGFSLSLLMFLGLVIPFTSCEVGLGESVDTQPPVVTIDYPPADSIIKESFVMEGSASDENGLKEVKLTFKSSSLSDFTPVEFVAELNEKKKKWTCTVDYKDAEGNVILPDGNYEVTVTATDKATRTSDQSRSISIDNTAPVLIIDNPSTTVDSSSVNKYGSSLKVVGRVVDAHDVDNLLFAVYDKDTDVLLTAPAQESSLAQNMEIVLGTYGEDGIYNEIYGSNEGTVEYKFKVCVSDEARTYKGSTVTRADDECGNMTESYYLYKQIYSPILKTYYTDAAQKTLINTKQIHSIIAGTFDGEIYKAGAQVTVENFLADLKNYEIKSVLTDDVVSQEAVEKALGTFSLNPTNNPYYTVSGIKSFTDNNYTEISKSHIITINAYMGLSESPLNTDTFAARLYYLNQFGKYVKEDGSATTNLEEATYFTIFDTKEKSTTDEAIAARNRMLDEDNDQITISLADFSEYISTNQRYQIVLLGQDEDKNDFTQDNRYCVLVKASSEAPTLKVTTPSGSTINIAGDEDAVFKGTVTNPSTEQSWVFAYLVKSGTDESGNDLDGLDDEDGVTELDPENRIYAIGDGSGTTLISDEDTWTLVIPKEKFAQDASSNYTIRIFAKEYGNDASNVATVDKYVYCDVELPSVEINVSPIIEYEEDTDGFVAGTKYVNGTIRVTGTATDDNSIESTVFNVYASATEDGTYTKISDTSDFVTPGTSNNEMRPYYVVDTKNELIDGKYVKFEFVSTDPSGNSNNALTSIISVNQDTDKPVITFNNVDKTLLDAEQISQGNNLFDQTSNNKLLGGVRDDDGIYSIIAWYSKDNSTWTQFYSKTGIESTSYSLSLPLTKNGAANGTAFDEGVYFIKIEVNDKQVPNVSNLYKFCVAVDAGNPVFGFTTVSGAYKAADTSFNVEGNVQDSSGTVTVSRFNTSDTSGTPAWTHTYTNAATSQTWTDTIAVEDISETGGNFYYVAKDKYGNLTT
ncbi:MAG: hypothetical protein IIT58_08720, partial [Treponema sp.]|nr:hypothetical protein [Treponema sp.]